MATQNLIVAAWNQAGNAYRKAAKAKGASKDAKGVLPGFDKATLEACASMPEPLRTETANGLASELKEGIEAPAYKAIIGQLSVDAALQCEHPMRRNPGKGSASSAPAIGADVLAWIKASAKK